MSTSDPPAETRTSRAARKPRKARARISLKMQAIGFLSRREHSRQELRAKLLDALRRRAREEAALAGAAEKAARELAQALQEQPSNGIDDAFAPARPAAAPAPARGTRGRASSRSALAAAPRAEPAESSGEAAAGQGGSPRAALATLTLATGAPLSATLRARLESAAAESTAPEDASREMAPASPIDLTGPGVGRSSAAPLGRASRPPATESRTREPDDEFIDVDADPFDNPLDDASSRPAAPLAATALELTDPEAAVDQLLDWLVANKYLSESRFVESRVNARSRKQGTMLIKLELSRHGLAMAPEQVAELRETEFARAQALWQRKFGTVAVDARERAKQARFLAARGFASGVVRRVVGGEEEF